MNWMGDLRGVQFFARAGGPFQAQTRSHHNMDREFVSFYTLTKNHSVVLKSPRSFSSPGTRESG